MNLPVVKKTPKTGPSTDADVLEQLAPLHPLPAKLLEYRQYAKLKSTYVDALPAWCIRRPAGSTPRSTRWWRPRADSVPAIRTCKTSRSAARRAAKSARPSCPAEPGWLLLAADYSQIELRVLAHFRGDQRLVRGLCPRRGHPRPGGQPGQRRAARGGHLGHAARGQGRQFRRDLRAKRVWVARALGIDQDAAQRSSTAISRGTRGSKNSSARYWPSAPKQAMLKLSLGGGARSEAFDPMPAAKGTSPNGRPSTR